MQQLCPERNNAPELGESRSTALRKFLSNERTLHRKNQWEQFNAVLQEYRVLGHVEPVPPEGLKKPASSVFYLPVHGVAKESSSTTKLWTVFDASAKSSSRVSFNQQLLTFGVTCSPFLTTRVLHQLAEDLCCKYPQAADTLVSNFYVDYCLMGALDVQGAKCLQQELCSLLNEAGLTLRKWRSNSEELLDPFQWTSVRASP